MHRCRKDTTQLTAREFCRELRRRRIGHQYGAIHRSGSLALIERIWKSLKEEYAHGLSLFRPLASIEMNLRAYAHWFNECRPHQGLQQRTPDEVYFGENTRATAVPLRCELVATSIANDHSLPALRLRAAA